MASLSRPPHRRKHSATTNASSSSSSSAASKNSYDDVLLSSGGKIKFQAHEYAEIFSGSSSIPVLDLSGLDDRPSSGDYRSSNLDYSSIFGGLRDGDAAVPYEELFNGGGVRKTETRPADPQSPFQESRSVEESDQSVDEIKQHINMSFNKISQNTSDASNGKTHIAQLNAVPGFTRFVDCETTVPSLKREVSRTWSFSAGVKSELTSKESHTPNNKAGDVNETKRKSQVFKVPPHHPVHPSSQNEDKDPRRSRLPSFASRDSSGKTAGEHSPPLFDEELDENSIAAVSAAALKKAIEQAQESIRIAKMIMERKKDGFLDGSKPRSKGRSKVKDKEETRISENVEAANAECGADILEFEKVDDKDNSICSKYKLVSDLEKEKNKPTVHWSKEPEVVAELAEIVDEVPEQCEATVDPIKGSENIAERLYDCSQEQEFRRDAGENSTISHEAEITEKDNLADDEGQCEEKVVDCEDMKSENITAWKVNDQHEKSGDEEEIGVMQKEEHLCLKSEQDVKESAEEEILKGELKISPEVEEVGETVNLVDESEIHEEKLNCRHEQDEIAERQMYTFQCEAAEVLKSEISEDAEEADMDEFEFQETASDKENGAVDAHSNDSSTTFSDTHINNTSSVFSETPEPCDVELNNKAQESDDRLHEETEIFSVIEDNESLHRCSSSEENLIGSKLNDGFEGLSSDSKAENVGLMDTDHEERLPNDDEMFKSANEIHNVSEVNMPNLPELHTCNDKVEEFDQTNVEQVLERTSESNEGYASTSNLEDTDEVSAHEAQTSAENANEKVKDDLDHMTSYEREFVEEQSELTDTDKSMEKTEREEEIGENMEKNEENLSETQTSAENANEKVKDDLDHMTSYEREFVEEQSELTDTDKSMEKTEREEEIGENMEKNEENLSETSTAAENDSKSKEQTFDTSDQQQRIEAIKRGREREKDRLAVERAIREARERAFTEARERAAAERAATEAKLRAERAAVERATAEARERALEKAMSQRTSTEAKIQGDKHRSDRFSSSSRNNGLKHSFSSSDLEKLDGTSSESAQRRKARLERHQRIMERSAKALAEKNMRDLLVQREQAERNRLAESLDVDIKRWATGKEGNLRALLSTLQYILGSDNGWQPIPLTEVITTAAVRKAYRKATLCVHPDKLQQRRATIQQKYICEKVFDLLKAAWNRFNSEER